MAVECTVWVVVQCVMCVCVCVEGGGTGGNYVVANNNVVVFLTCW